MSDKQVNHKKCQKKLRESERTGLVLAFAFLLVGVAIGVSLAGSASG